MNRYLVTIREIIPHPSGNNNYSEIYQQEFTGTEADIKRIASAVNEQPFSNPNMWRVPNDMYEPPKTFSVRKECIKCRMNVDGVIGYVCVQPGCPSGLGGPQC